MRQQKSPSFVKGFKYRIYPTQEQRQQLEKVFGCCRFVYNQLLAESIKEYETYKELKESGQNLLKKPDVSAFYLTSKIPALKQNLNYPWLPESAAAQTLQQEAIHLGQAYQKFLKERKGFPNRKKKSNQQSATFTNQSFSINTDNRLKLYKFRTTIKVNWHRELPRIKFSELTISKTPSGKYYISIIAQYEPKKTSGVKITGIDAGLSKYATFSDGRELDNPRHFVRSQKQLKRLQQSLSRKVKGSKNRTKARLRVAKLHEKISNQRSAFLHNLTTSIIRENQAIGIERLAVSNMVKNRKLAKHIADAGWGEFRRQLLYKAQASQQCSVFLADPYFPSTQLCSCCGLRPVQKIRLGVKEWVCEFCGSVHGRDHNAAENLRQLAEYEFYRLEPEQRYGAVVLVKSYGDFLLRPISIRSQPVEGSCAVRHPIEAGTTMLVE